MASIWMIDSSFVVVGSGWFWVVPYFSSTEYSLHNSDLATNPCNRSVHGQYCIMGNQDKQYRYGSNPSEVMVHYFKN